MDNLPKNKPDDVSSFAGKYPDQEKATVPGSSPPAVGVTAPVPPPPAPTTGEAPVDYTPTFPSSFESTTTPAPESAPSQPVMSTFAETAATSDVTPAPFTETTGVIPPPPLPTENQFTTVSIQQPIKSGGGGFKKLLLILIILIILISIGFVGFRVLGKYLAQDEPLTLTYWGLWENEATLTPLITEYKKTHPKVEIVYSKQSPKQYRERLQAAISRGEGPDIFRFHNTWVPMLKDDLAPSGQTGYQVAEIEQTFYPVVKEDLVISSKVYGAPLMMDGLGLYYNEDLLRAAGVTPPSSWDDFRKAALALTVKDETGQIVTAGAALGTANNVEHFSDIIALMMLQNGADLKNPVSQEAQDALSFYRLFAEPPNSVWSETLDNSILAFAGGKVAFIFAPSWQVFTIRQLNPNIHFQIISVPQLPAVNVTWASYWVEGVSSKSQHIDEAWEFLKFLTTKESMVTLYTETSKTRAFGEPYSRVDLAQTLINDQYVGPYIRQAPVAKSFFLSSRTFDNGINDRMIKYLEDAVNSLGKGVSVQAALETAGQGFQQVLSSFGYTSAAP